MNAEISPEITAAVTSDGPIGPQVQQTIVTAAMNAQKNVKNSSTLTDKLVRTTRNCQSSVRP